MAEGKSNRVDMILHTERIRIPQKELGLPESNFPKIAVGDRVKRLNRVHP